MTRHKGRHRPFARLRYDWPRHCACSTCNLPAVHLERLGLSLFDMHPVRTVAR